MVTRARREQERAQKAAPSAEARRAWGCDAAMLALAAVCVWLYSVTSWRWWLVPSALIGVVFAYAICNRLYEVGLLMSARQRWAPAGVRCLVIHSDSPVWSEYIQAEWFPRLSSVARWLNWSQRATWRSSLEVRLFRQFCFARFNYNPSVLVFRGLRAPLVFRYFYAFHEAKHGNRQCLEALEAEMFAALAGPRGGPTRS
jgi:hypothetical protein